MEYYHKIAGIGVKLNSSIEIEVGCDMLPFLTEAFEEVDEVINLVSEKPTEPEEKGYQDGFHRFCKNHSYRYSGEKGNLTAEMDWENGVCRCDPDWLRQCRQSLPIWNHIGLESLLIRHDRLILHAAFIRHNGRGILFSAPSGTGKSTQASLWEEFAGAEVINGDRAGLVHEDSRGWSAWGLPYAGSSGIYKNESAPIEAIVVLKQAEKNQIQQLKPMQALTYLLPEFNLHRWDKDFMDRALGLINQLIPEVPIYLLECRPDKEAVEVLQKKLEERRA